jgi:Leucine-rich repeat (LRR) protein
LWLDGNGIRCIHGVSHLENLRALHLAQNLITDIGDGLVGLTNLMTLNLASNRLTRLDGVFLLGGNLSFLAFIDSVARIAPDAVCRIG